MASTSLKPEFVQLLTDNQVLLRGFVLASVADHVAADEIVQRTNLSLCRKASGFREGAPFLPWAIAIARYEILSFVRDKKRDRLVLSPEVVELMADAATRLPEAIETRQQALRACLGKMNTNQRRVLDLRYVHGKSITAIAEAIERSNDGVKSLLARLRRSLAECITRNVAAESDV